MIDLALRAPEVCRFVGISYRQLDYWDTTGLVTPSLQKAHGSGTQRLYSEDDLLHLAVVKRLCDAVIDVDRVREQLFAEKVAG